MPWYITNYTLRSVLWGASERVCERNCPTNPTTYGQRFQNQIISSYLLSECCKVLPYLTGLEWTLKTKISAKQWTKYHGGYEELQHLIIISIYLGFHSHRVYVAFHRIFQLKPSSASEMIYVLKSPMYLQILSQ